MTTTAMLTMALVCGAVWGGLAVLLVYAARREAAKRRAGTGEPGDR